VPLGTLRLDPAQREDPHVEAACGAPMPSAAEAALLCASYVTAEVCLRQAGRALTKNHTPKAGRKDGRRGKPAATSSTQRRACGPAGLKTGHYTGMLWGVVGGD
jgi:hypothetical protein